MFSKIFVGTCLIETSTDALCYLKEPRHRERDGLMNGFFKILVRKLCFSGSLFFVS